ncbi:MAG: efflux RND transporter periplasmic adaptor subunit [Planctomycetota bacterium]
MCKHPCSARCILWVVFLGIVGVSESAHGQPATPVRVAAVQEQLVQDKVRLNGTLHAVRQSAVATQEAGLVNEVLVDEGASVTAGMVIARLDRRRMNAELAERQADLASTQALLEEAKANRDLAASEFERMRGAFETRASSADEFNEAKFRLAAAEARVASADRSVMRIERAIEAVNIRMADLDVVAPYDGLVVDRAVDPGEWLDAGDAVLTIVSTGTIEVWLDVPERYSGFDSSTTTFPIEVDGVGLLDSTDVRRVPQMNPRARTFRVIAALDDEQGRLQPGMSATAFMPTGRQRTSLCVPADAVLRDGGGAFVYRAVERSDGVVAEMVPVRVLFDADGLLAVDSAELAEDDRVVVEGNERLMPGQAIVPSESEVASE